MPRLGFRKRFCKYNHDTLICGRYKNGMCKKCHSTTHYEYNNTRKKLCREWINTLKTKPCIDCGVQYNPWQMEFDHRDPSTKSFSIALKVSCKQSTILKEISKCDLVCSNCHAERTYRRRHAH